MNEITSDLFREKILNVLKYSIEFFERHNLHWFIACGSAIGAVRHKGLIPWDDDIDIYMPRADYNKLISIRNEMVADGYRFIYMKDDGYPLAFGKIKDDKTTLWQHRRYPFNVGCYIDVFPLDLTDIGMMSFGKKWMSFRIKLYLYRAKISRITLKGIIADLKKKKTDSIKVIPFKILLLFTKKESLLKSLESMERSWNKEYGDRYVSFTEIGMYMFPKAWFDEYIMIPFEDIEVRISKYYHEYLTYIYGDYMTPPPPEQQHGEGPHGKLYLNLNENVPIEKVKKMV